MVTLSELEDPRRPSNGTRHDFREILVIAVCAMLSDADSFEDIALWGRLKAGWLGRFLILKNGIPSQYTFLRVFRVLDPKQFESAFRRWVGGIVGALDGHVAVDGKTMRRSADGDAPPVHMVSAFSTGLGLVLGQEKVAGKSNELSALPELLDALHLKGLLVSIDAQGCQRDIAAKVIAKGGDYLLAVKGNQPTLHQVVRDLVTDAQNRGGAMNTCRTATAGPCCNSVGQRPVARTSTRPCGLHAKPWAAWSHSASSATRLPSSNSVTTSARNTSPQKSCRGPCAPTGKSRTAFTGCSTFVSARTTAWCARTMHHRTCRFSRRSSST